MTQHTLKYSHKRRGSCKADKGVAEEQVIEKVTDNTGKNNNNYYR